VTDLGVAFIFVTCAVFRQVKILWLVEVCIKILELLGTSSAC